MTRTTDRLPPVTPDQRAAILAAPRTEEAHRQLMADTPAMDLVQTGGAPSRTRLAEPLTVLAWNVERCLFPQKSAALARSLAPDVLLLSEMDHGMARTGQRHTTEEMAEALGMVYAYGVEFHELGLGGEVERPYCTDDHNHLGWHGNAILSSAPLLDVRLIRLDDHGHWFTNGADPDQPRIGGRMALAAIVETDGGEICVVSTHLESNAGAAHRAGQMAVLLDGVDRFAPGMPVLLGGDLNTGNHLLPGQDWRDETLFALAEARGYSWDFTAPGVTTRPSRLTPHPDRVMTLDWIAGRDMAPLKTGKLPALDNEGGALADHDVVWCRAVRR